MVRTVGIIGYGDFGSFVYEFIQEKFPEVSIVVHDPQKTVDGEKFVSLDVACKSEVIVLSVPISELEHVIGGVAGCVPKDAIVLDVSTVKVYPARILKKHNNTMRYVAAHPMFGPYSYKKKGGDISGFRIVVCEHNLSDDVYMEAISFFEKLGFDVLELTAKEHDRRVAETLFLTHLVGQVVAKGGFKRTEIDTVSFGFLMHAVESVKNDTKLFEDVFAYNPYCRDVLRRFNRARQDVIDSLEK